MLSIEPEVVKETEETSLSFTGAVSSLGADATIPMLVVDTGKGSTELVLGDSEVCQATSIDMGAVRMTERSFARYSPEVDVPLEDQGRAIAWTDGQLDATEKVVDISRVRTLIDVADMVATLTAQGPGLTAYQPKLIHDTHLSLEEAEAAIRFMIDQPIAVEAVLGFILERCQNAIAGGALIRSRIATRVPEKTAIHGTVISTITASEHDILDGIVTSLA